MKYHHIKKAIWVVSVLGLLSAVGCGKHDEHSAGQQLSADSSSRLEKFSWLTGTWKNQSSARNAFESWEKEDKQAMVGRGYTVEGGDTTVSEMLQLEEKDGDIFYIATVPQNPGPVYFKLVKMDEGEFVFENPEHDFPNRIIYMRQGEDSLHVRIEGMGKSEGKKVDFMFIRK